MKYSVDVPVTVAVRVDVQIDDKSIPSGARETILARIQALGAPIGLDEESDVPLQPAGIRMVESNDPAPEPEPDPAAKPEIVSEDDLPALVYEDARQGRQIFVDQGIGGENGPWMSFWRKLDGTGSMHRVKSTNLPERPTRNEAQRDLNEYAKVKCWAVLDEDPPAGKEDEVVPSIFDQLDIGSRIRFCGDEASEINVEILRVTQTYPSSVDCVNERTGELVPNLPASVIDTEAYELVESTKKEIPDEAIADNKLFDAVHKREGAAERWADRKATGLTDEELDTAISEEVGGPFACDARTLSDLREILNIPYPTAPTEDFVPTPFSSYVRPNDLFVRTKPIPGMPQEPKQVLSVDRATEHIVTSAGPLAFKILDEKYRLVLSESTVAPGDVLNNGVISATVDEVRGKIGLTLSRDGQRPWSASWGEIDGKWWMMERTPLPEPVEEIEEPVSSVGTIAAGREIVKNNDPKKRGKILEVEETAALMQWDGVEEPQWLSLEAIEELYTVVTADSETI